MKKIKYPRTAPKVSISYAAFARMLDFQMRVAAINRKHGFTLLLNEN